MGDNFPSLHSDLVVTGLYFDLIYESYKNIRCQLCHIFVCFTAKVEMPCIVHRVFNSFPPVVHDL
jgi:hypothetical protein